MIDRTAQFTIGLSGVSGVLLSIDGNVNTIRIEEDCGKMYPGMHQTLMRMNSTEFACLVNTILGIETKDVHEALERFAETCDSVEV